MLGVHAGVLLKSDVTAGRIEGVKVHNCILVAVQTGIRAESVLELNVMQNHINCGSTGIVATNADQCFFQGNLIYHNSGQGRGIWINGKNKIATSHVVTGNIIAGVRVRPTALSFDPNPSQTCVVVAVRWCSLTSRGKSSFARIGCM